jgi:hypothetical protein
MRITLYAALQYYMTPAALFALHLLFRFWKNLPARAGVSQKHFCAVGQLFVAPAPKRLEQVMFSAQAFEVAHKSLVSPPAETSTGG